MSDSNESADPSTDESRTGGAFALVCYVPDPLKSEIEVLQAGLSDRTLPPVHITVLPPRPVFCDVQDACREANVRTRDFASFQVELSAVRCFTETNFLYIDIEAGSGHLRDLHAQLNAGALRFDETYEYRPHLTLAGPLEQNRLSEFQHKTADAWLGVTSFRGVKVQELVCLWLAGETEEWVRVGSFFLREPGRSQTAAG